MPRKQVHIQYLPFTVKHLLIEYYTPHRYAINFVFSFYLYLSNCLLLGSGLLKIIIYFQKNRHRQLNLDNQCIKEFKYYGNFHKKRK